MFEYVFEIGILKWEMERLDGEAARRYRAGLVRSEGERQLLTDLAQLALASC